ncbi:MAG: hypothetical protein GX329_05685 [Tissierellia bacterium]|nr:hypothetical protein [Tissierellia bacterium]
MKLNTEEILKKKLLDAQEMVRDYESYSKEIGDAEVSDLFKDFAEESGYQARKLRQLLDKLNKN